MTHQKVPNCEGGACVQVVFIDQEVRISLTEIPDACVIMERTEWDNRVAEAQQTGTLNFESWFGTEFAGLAAQDEKAVFEKQVLAGHF